MDPEDNNNMDIDAPANNGVAIEVEPAEVDQHYDDGNPHRISFVPQPSIQLMNGDLAPMEGRVFQATWEGDYVEGMNALAVPLLNSLMNGNQSPVSLGYRVNRSPGGQGGGGAGSGGNGGPKGGNPLTFKDCGGLEKQVSYIKTAVLDPLSGNSRSGVSRFGLQAPKGVLFYGPPGTGKTRLAMAVSNEIKKVLRHPVHFIYRKGQDVASKYFGQSAQNLRRVFDEAIALQPSLIFFDELDGLCPSRDSPNPHQTNVTIVTTMLGLMDELPKGKVFVIGATNRLEAIDAALRRPGRFDKHLEFLPPSEVGRLEILRIHTASWKAKPEVEFLRGLSQKTVGFSGADLAKLCLDAFDHALGRAIDGANGNFRSSNLRNLNVVEQDWQDALGKMKPSNNAVFGSSLYTHPPSLGDHVSSLLESNVMSIVEEVVNILPSTKSLNAPSSVLSLHILSNSDDTLGKLDESIISESLRSRELDKFTMYSISPVAFSSIPKTMWGTRINQIFTQALESPQPSILYIQQADQWWDMLERAKLGYALNLKGEIERLRGKCVLLLTSGLPSSKLPIVNPLKEVIGTGRNYEIEPPSDDERYNFFQPIFSLACLAATDKWTANELMTLDQTFETTLEYTEGREMGSMLLLHDQMKEVLLNSQEDDVVHILEAMSRIVGAYRLN